MINTHCIRSLIILFIIGFAFIAHGTLTLDSEIWYSSQPASTPKDGHPPSQTNPCNESSISPTPINNGFKEYYLKVPIKPFPENASILYKGKEVGFHKYTFLGRSIDWGIDSQHYHIRGEDYIILGVGSLWSWTPGHWGWQNAENWEIIIPCP